mmetsp:Transcript_1210/g.4967  ORF Transcript_1210/g.4967 Transcript_1210/m.4967 type:complete len:434 (+) Transcript_1210:58-1359(+)|eukprot:CAMPEP_0203867028 /NCGR_PEP_ID=MMETSP0359-20131031/16290_1 /ASSEMBLY_ACC=CAM_ASM_000338 /TAXON_ID=268821 /ORGANISM="Scrippsiella Hangoei, Strain SHTV-5" /LENGTH=433 /DNA_ID=CAMNT_0050785217 /DNA_START=58 /DNA_END=1359 /DNA_ORIENTATION=+
MASALACRLTPVASCFAVSRLRASVLAARCFADKAWLEKRMNLESMTGRSRYTMSQHRQGVLPALAQLGEISLEQKDTVHQILGCASKRQWQEAMELFRTLKDPGLHARVALLMALTKAFKEDLAWNVFRDVPSPKPLPAFNLMLTMLSRSRKIEQVEDLLLEMKSACLEPNAITYTTTMTAYGTAGDAGAAVRVLEEMEAKGMLLTEVEFGTAIAACGKSADHPRAAALVAKMESLAMVPHIGHLTSVMLGCSFHKHSEVASEVWADIHRRGLRPDVVSYTCFASCFSGPGALEKVLGLKAEMISVGLRPHSYFYGELLRIVREDGNNEAFQSIMQEMDREGIERNSRVELRIRQHQSGLERGQQSHSSGALGATPAFAHAAAAEAPPSLAPPAQPSVLPAGWQSAPDPTTGQHYYWQEHNPTGSVTWERPA